MCEKEAASYNLNGLPVKYMYVHTLHKLHVFYSYLFPT